jgi:hypothetical protein
VAEIPLSSTAEFGLPSNPQDFPAGTYTVRILESGSTVVVMTLSSMTFEPGVLYDLLLPPDASGLSLNPVLIAHRE